MGAGSQLRRVWVKYNLGRVGKVGDAEWEWIWGQQSEGSRESLVWLCVTCLSEKIRYAIEQKSKAWTRQSLRKFTVTGLHLFPVRDSDRAKPLKLG